MNFGIIYGQGAFALAEQTGLSRTEAKQLIDSYYETYPKLKEFMAEQSCESQKIRICRNNFGQKTPFARHQF